MAQKFCATKHDVRRVNENENKRQRGQRETENITTKIEIK